MDLASFLRIALLFVLCAVVAACGSGATSPTAPTASAAPPPSPLDAIVLAREDGADALTLAVDNGRARATVFDGEGRGVKGLAVTIAGRRTSSCGSGCYEAKTGQRGTIPVVVAGRRFTFDVPPDAPDATALVTRATRRFHELRSVRFVQRLASSPRKRIVTTFTLEAPNRFAYRIHGGASAVVIGARRWDRTSGSWTRSQSTTFPQPSPDWGGVFTNAHVLMRTATTETVSFLNPSIPAWFTIRFDPRTLRPRALDMTATAHFMHDRYLDFNAPRRVFPPR
jgi:hypothetical protein